MYYIFTTFIIIIIAIITIIVSSRAKRKVFLRWHEKSKRILGGREGWLDGGG